MPPKATRALQILGRPACMAAGYTIALRAVYALFATIMLDRLHLDPRLVYSNAFTDRLMPTTDRFLYATLGVWNASILFGISTSLEWAMTGPRLPSSIRCIPRSSGDLRAGSSTATGGAGGFHRGFVLLLLGLQVLVEFDLPRSTAIKAVYLAGLWPASFMLLAGYPTRWWPPSASVPVLCRKSNWWSRGCWECSRRLRRRWAAW